MRKFFFFFNNFLFSAASLCAVFFGMEYLSLFLEEKHPEFLLHGQYAGLAAISFLATILISLNTKFFTRSFFKDLKQLDLGLQESQKENKKLKAQATRLRKSYEQQSGIAQIQKDRIDHLLDNIKQGIGFFPKSHATLLHGLTDLERATVEAIEIRVTEYSLRREDEEIWRKKYDRMANQAEALHDECTAERHKGYQMQGQIQELNEQIFQLEAEIKNLKATPGKLMKAVQKAKFVRRLIVEDFRKRHGEKGKVWMEKQFSQAEKLFWKEHPAKEPEKPKEKIPVKKKLPSYAIR